MVFIFSFALFPTFFVLFLSPYLLLISSVFFVSLIKLCFCSNSRSLSISESNVQFHLSFLCLFFLCRVFDYRPICWSLLKIVSNGWADVVDSFFNQLFFSFWFDIERDIFFFVRSLPVSFFAFVTQQLTEQTSFRAVYYPFIPYLSLHPSDDHKSSTTANRLPVLLCYQRRSASRFFLSKDSFFALSHPIKNSRTTMFSIFDPFTTLKSLSALSLSFSFLCFFLIFRSFLTIC